MVLLVVIELHRTPVQIKRSNRIVLILTLDIIRGRRKPAFKQSGRTLTIKELLSKRRQNSLSG
jgi:hypothetical protein